MRFQDFQKHFFCNLNHNFLQKEKQFIFSILCRNLLGWDKPKQILNSSVYLSDDILKLFLEAIDRLNKKEPIQYILGEAYFYDLILKVNSSVLIPRPETEQLVEWILDDFQKCSKKAILDIGTGSGCIALSLAKHRVNWNIEGIDINKKALEIAKYNAEALNLTVKFFEFDIMNVLNFPKKSYDILVSNPPYILQTEKMQMSGNVLNFEPPTALFVPDESPFIFYDKIICLAKQNLKPGSSIYFEINEFLADEHYERLKKWKFDFQIKKDISGKYRMIRIKI